MMKLILKYTIFILFFIYIFLLSFPKINFYYFIEQKLQKNDILISNEQIEDKALSFIIKDAKIFYKNIKISNIDNMSIYPYLFFNKIIINKIRISSDFEDFVPLNINNIVVNYHILNPIIVSLEASGEFGKINAQIDLIEQNIALYLVPSNKMKNKYRNILKKMKKIKGQDKYEYKYKF